MKKILIAGTGILILLLFYSWISIYPDWLWFENLSFSPVFLTMMVSKFGFGFIVWLVLIIILSANLYAAQRFKTSGAFSGGFGSQSAYFQQLGLSSRALTSIFVGFVLIVSFIIASKASMEWDMVLRYLYQESFGKTDPIFKKDIGFYVFSLPFYLFIRSGLQVLFLFAGLVSLSWYLKEGALQIEGEFPPPEGVPPSFPKITVAPTALKHIIFLGACLVLLVGWGYLLKVYNLLYSSQGPAFGASYTDVHVKVLAYRIMMIISICFSIMLFIKVFNLFKLSTKHIWIGAAIWVGSMLVFGHALPILVQKFIVKPNELAKESPYIAHNIDYTRDAYGLNKIMEVNFQVKDKLSTKDIEGHQPTIQNIRIWDERPLLQTYRQIQSIRLYYDFNNVDVDRYMIGNQYRQVTLAARELVVKNLPPQAYTWVNRHLIYTHGYGAASSPVNQVTREGLPHLLIKDLPPTYELGLKIDRPEIYYGEKTDEYVLVKTNTKEFDYPKGDKNVYTLYQGKGGVHIKSFVRRLLYAIEFLDPQILFTTYIGPETRIMYNRRIDRRAGLVAPFLEYDADPYLVVSEGRLYWILDAYTTSDMYPYSRRSYGILKSKGINYIRNSVKVTIDAYTGNISFYIVDEKDPIARTYSRIFPNLFKPFETMPEDLKRHVRYPKDLFKIQVATYTTYHMEDVQVFYNQEDLWQTPDELYGDSRQKMEPYYIILKLPESQKEEFILMIPFTPSKKDNMIGWLAARSDLPFYGNLLVYKLPKEKLVYGPMQIEARVDQQTEISRELSLWGQRGSRVIRGNLLAIPVSDSFLYVEPIYLVAQQEETKPASPAPRANPFGSSGKRRLGTASREKPRVAALPELKRVIVALGNRLVMEENLDKALNSVLEIEETIKKAALHSSAPTRVDTASGLARTALEHYNRAKDALRRGDWAKYGRELENMEKILNDLSASAETKK